MSSHFHLLEIIVAFNEFTIELNQSIENFSEDRSDTNFQTLVQTYDRLQELILRLNRWNLSVIYDLQLIHHIVIYFSATYFEFIFSTFQTNQHKKMSEESANVLKIFDQMVGISPDMRVLCVGTIDFSKSAEITAKNDISKTNKESPAFISKCTLVYQKGSFNFSF